MSLYVPRKVALIATLLAMSPMTTKAAEFRVETAVFQGNRSQPMAQNLTLFTTGAVYDFSLGQESGEITIFDPGRGRFVLLDQKRRVQSELALDHLGEIVAELQTRGIQAGREPHLYAPKFDERFDSQRAQVTLHSEKIVYSSKGLAPPAGHVAAVQSYKRFADWFARLNVTHRQSYPPFSRMKLNEALERRGLVPAEISLTINMGKNQAVYHSRHAVDWQLTQDDRRRIEDVAGMLQRFDFVEFPQYRAGQ